MLLGSLMVTPHCQEVISKRSNGQTGRTHFRTVGHVGDLFDVCIIFATDDVKYLKHKAAS